MNYRHAYHAGNFADVAKHLAVVAALLYLRRKDGAFAVIDTHAGRGKYDLESVEARRTGEAEAGVRRLAGLAAPDQTALSTYLGLARGDSYPGSPLIAAKLLRPQDRLVAIEKNAAEASLLTEVLKPFRRASVETADGYARLAALLPPAERRGLVLIDPPYESEGEFSDAARAFAAAYRRFATGIYVIWFPVKSQAEANRFCGEVLSAGVEKALRVDVSRADAQDGRLSAAGMIIVNPPWYFAEELGDAWTQVMPRLGAQLRLERIAGD